MPAFGPELTQLNPAVKAHLAECILKAAAQGHTSYGELVRAASEQIQLVVSLLT